MLTELLLPDMLDSARGLGGLGGFGSPGAMLASLGLSSSDSPGCGGGGLCDGLPATPNMLAAALSSAGLGAL
eukprot:153067-Chlamydomonas_euryale.AAC.1